MLVAELGHPRAAALGAARVEIQIEHRHELLGTINLKDLHVRMIRLDFLRFLQTKPVECRRQSEYAVNYLVKREIDLQLFHIEAEFFLPQLLHIVAEVPTLEFALKSLIFSELL